MEPLQISYTSLIISRPFANNSSSPIPQPLPPQGEGERCILIVHIIFLYTLSVW